MREREDIHALRCVSVDIQVESLGLLDAPVRLNTTLPGLSSPDNEKLLAPGEIESLAMRMQPYFSHCLVLAPLSLGNHIDHKAVHFAALKAHNSQRLGFYEDLPYLSWTSEEDLKRQITEVERVTLSPLRSAIIRNPRAQARKFRAVSGYRSQIDRAMAKVIANSSNKYARGERIWIPRHSSAWNRFVLSAKSKDLPKRFSERPF